MRKSNIHRWGSWLAMLGGLSWVIKSASIMLTDYQPPQLFEFGQALVGFGVLALYVCLHAPQRAAYVGAWLAGIGILSRLAATIIEQIPGASISGAEGFVFPYSLFVLLATVGAFIGLLLVGLPARKDGTLAVPWRSIPMYTLFAFIPLAFTAVIHIEIPILLIGFGWILIGYAILRVQPGK